MVATKAVWLWAVLASSASYIATKRTMTALIVAAIVIIVFKIKKNKMEKK